MHSHGETLRRIGGVRIKPIPQKTLKGIPRGQCDVLIIQSWAFERLDSRLYLLGIWPKMGYFCPKASNRSPKWGKMPKKGIRHEEVVMRRTDYKGKRIKRNLTKCCEVFKSYDRVQDSYGTMLENDPEIVEIKCNVPLEDHSIGEYTTDFVCTKEDGSIMVRECVYRKNLLRPKTITLLDFSQRYWYPHPWIYYLCFFDESFHDKQLAQILA